ncbi:MAG: HNH endonuclease [Prevotella sp.]|nr:HNH endonuclease [Prevotella sp.]
MKYWIVPSNDSTFRIGDAIAAQDGLVDWRTDKFSAGDIVFIYKTQPDKRIHYKMEVVKAKMIFEDVIEQEPFWTDKELYYSNYVTFYARLRLLEEYTDDVLSLHHLHEHGYQGIPRSVRECKDEGLIEFLLHPHQTVNDDVYDVDYPEDDEKLYEGALITVKANKYERNQKARRECVAQKGYQCLVCGRDFEATYGEIGKRFIHVHHLTPISSIGQEYELNVEKDLVPVCPNCHYMLHRKDPPYTIEELKEKLQEAAAPAKKRPSKKAVEIRLVAEAAILRNVNDDSEVRKLIHNMMEMDGGTMMKNILSVCISMFQERYNSMQPNDWRHLIDDYVRAVTHRPDLQEDELFYFKVAG